MAPPDSTAVAQPPALARFAAALRRPANWLQLIQFGLVGGSGFLVNTLVYWLLLRKAGVHYLPSAAAAFCVAVMNNFMWNRGWTFRHVRDDSHAAFQAMRFFVVSFAAFIVSAALLTLFVESFHLQKVLSQLLAVGIVMPFSFLGNKLWSFRRDRR